MSEVPDRLRWAVEEHAGISIREFQRRMDERDVRGSSYATVHGYLHGESAPSVEFLREAADVLGVRDEWLVLGRGPRSGRDRGRSGPGGGGDAGPAARLRARIRKQIPSLSRLRKGERDLFFEVLTRYALTAPDIEGEGAGEAEEEIAGLAADLVFLLELPAGPDAWGFRAPAVHRERFHHYVVAMLHALSLLMEGRGEGAPTSEARSSRVRRLRKRAAEVPTDEGGPTAPSAVSGSGSG